MQTSKDTTETLDKIYGCLYGQAIGDALGLGTEFLDKEEVLRLYPSGLNNYAQIVQDEHRCRWAKGAWTDDTDMMLCVLRAFDNDGFTTRKVIVNEGGDADTNAAIAGSILGAKYGYSSIPQYYVENLYNREQFHREVSLFAKRLLNGSQQ